MTVTVQIDHTYYEPVENVAATHLSKYPNEYDPNVTSCNVVEKKISGSGISYTKRIAICKNILPYILRKVSSLNVKEIEMEEDCTWNRNKREFSVSSRNLTWSSWVCMEESSRYEPNKTNGNWTNFTQEGSITVFGLGKFGSILEMFAKRFLMAGAARSIKVTERLMAEKRLKYFSFWYSQFIFA